MSVNKIRLCSYIMINIYKCDNPLYKPRSISLSLNTSRNSALYTYVILVQIYILLGIPNTCHENYGNF